MNPFARLAPTTEGLPPWLALRARLEGEDCPVWVAPIRALAALERKELEALASQVCQRFDGAYLGLSLYGPLDYAPLRSLDWLGLRAESARNPPAGARLESVRSAWRQVLEAWGDAQGAKPNKNPMPDAEAVRLLPLGRAKGFPARVERQLAEFIRAWAGAAPEASWLAVEPLALVPEGEWIGQIGPEGLKAWPHHPFEPFGAPNAPGQSPPPGLPESAERLAEAVEAELLAPARLEFLWGPAGVRLLGLEPERGHPSGRLRLLLKRLQDERIDATGLARALAPSEVEALLVGRLTSTEGLEPLDPGPITTAQAGAASGALYCSAQALLAAGEGPKILALPEVYPEDLPALQAATGLIITEGGYAAHGPVMARGLGLPALILSEGLVESGALRLNGKLLEQGTEVCWQGPLEGPAELYLGSAPLAPPEPEVLERLGQVLRDCAKPMELLVNGEEPGELARAFAWGAQGVGLLRLENLLGEEPQLSRLRALALGADRPELATDLAEGLKRSLLRLLDRQTQGGILRVRLMDFPWHELLPRPGEPTEEAARKLAGLVPGRSPAQWAESIEGHREVNPMLGLRGARLALARFELYRPQALALLEAVELIHRKHHRLPRVQVMVPFVGRAAELEALIQGRREVEGLVPLARHWMEERGFVLPPFEVEWGGMVELPGAVLDARELARHASFFSFGGNDLTQTLLGHSRDDWARLGAMYQRLDLGADPFVRLDSLVLEAVELASERGRALRPDLDLSFCGEQRLSETDLQRLAEMGLNSVSVPPLQVPGTLLRLVRLGLLE